MKVIKYVGINISKVNFSNLINNENLVYNYIVLSFLFEKYKIYILLI